MKTLNYMYNWDMFNFDSNRISPGMKHLHMEDAMMSKVIL